MTDFEKIRESLLGHLPEPRRVPWVEDISRVGTAYDKASQDLWTARAHLCQRFGMDWKDEDLELIMSAISHLEKDVARGMFDAAMLFVKKINTCKNRRSSLRTAPVLCIKKSLNKAPAADRRIFCLPGAVWKTGNTYSIPLLSKSSGEPKSLAVSSCRFIQSFLKEPSAVCQG